MSGHEVLEAIRADPATRLLPVVMMTGMATTAEKLRAQSAGVTDFIAKPFSPEELLRGSAPWSCSSSSPTSTSTPSGSS